MGVEAWGLRRVCWVYHVLTCFRRATLQFVMILGVFDV